MKKQPTLKQLNQSSKNMCKTQNNFSNTDFTNKTQKQYDDSKLRMNNSHSKYWEMVESVTQENPEYSEIINNGHYEG